MQGRRRKGRIDKQLLAEVDIEENAIRCEGSMIYDLTFAK